LPADPLDGTEFFTSGSVSLPKLIGYLTGYASARVGKDDADDIVQESLLATWQRRESITSGPAEYAFGVAKHLIARCIHLQIGSRQRRRALSPEIPSPAPTPEEAAVVSEVRTVVAMQVSALSGRNKEVIERWLEGQTPQEIQRDMRLTPTQERLCKSRAKQTVVRTVRRKFRLAA